MKTQELEKLGISQRLIEKIRNEKILTLYPPQTESIKAGVLEGRNIVLSVPTAAGKTLVATLAMAKTLEKKKKFWQMKWTKLLRKEKLRGLSETPRT